MGATGGVRVWRHGGRAAAWPGTGRAWRARQVAYQRRGRAPTGRLRAPTVETMDFERLAVVFAAAPHGRIAQLAAPPDVASMYRNRPLPPSMASPPVAGAVGGRRLDAG